MTPDRTNRERAISAALTARGLVEAVEAAGRLLAMRTREQMDLSWQLSVRKDEAVRRIMSAQSLSATAAEKLAEQDAEYAACCHAKSAAEADRLEADAAYRAAQYRASLAIVCITIESHSPSQP